jgi:hypothetical protein
MHATVAAEGEDGFDALSRSFAYVNQRPIRYAACAAAAWALGTLGLIVVELFARTTMHMTQWALAFGAPGDLLATLFQGGSAPVSPMARSIHSVWLSLVAVVAHGWVYSYFWTSAAFVYLVLRHDVDGTPWHVIALPEPRAFESDTTAAVVSSGAPTRDVPAASSPPPVTSVASNTATNS